MDPAQKIFIITSSSNDHESLSSEIEIHEFFDDTPGRIAACIKITELKERELVSQGEFEILHVIIGKEQTLVHRPAQWVIE